MRPELSICRHSGARASPETITPAGSMDSPMCNCTSEACAKRAHPGMTAGILERRGRMTRNPRRKSAVKGADGYFPIRYLPGPAPAGRAGSDNASGRLFSCFARA
jgi:hypothetical protein